MRGSRHDGHRVPAEFDALRERLQHLQSAGIDLGDVIVISPFKDVGQHLRLLPAEFDERMRAGTIHTAQGQEANIVFLVLGGDPARPGAKTWAASTPNLVNVAASRAKQRLYVIGDRQAWSGHRYFDTLERLLRGP